MRQTGLRVLVVDDDPEIGEVLNNIFSYDGAVVRVTASVKDGLTAQAADVFDLVLLDYVICEKVAEQFLAHMKPFASGAFTPVIVVSGHGELLSLDRFKDFPQVKAVVTKPFDPGVLLGLAGKARK